MMAVRLLISIFALISVAGVEGAAQQPAPDRAWWDTVPASSSARSPRPWSRESRLVTMRDGVRLAVDVYLPTDRSADEVLPTILEQTRYFRSYQRTDSILDRQVGPPLGLITFVQDGYAVVVSDARGTGASFGTRAAEFSPAEVEDGYDLVEWIVAQSWSNGRVGGTGVSYPGTTAEFLGTVNHPAVRAVAPRFSLTDFYADVSHPGGIFLDPFFRTWDGMVRNLDRNVISAGQRALVTGVRPITNDLLAAALREHETNGYIYGQVHGLRARDDRMSNGWLIDTISPHSRYRDLRHRPAVYNYSGWVDGGFGYAAIKRYLAAPAPGSRLTIGPWNHGGAWATYPGTSPRRTSFNQLGELRRFFDHHLLDRATGIDHDLPIHYYTTGEDRWHATDQWPPLADERILHAGGDGRLADSPSAGGAVVGRFAVDTTLGTGQQGRWNTILGGAPVSYPSLDITSGGTVVFTTAPLDAPLTITGHPVAVVAGRYTTDDPTLFVYLEQVDSTGRGSMITEGQLRLRHRKVSPAPTWYPVPTAYHTYLMADTLPVPIGERIEAAIELLPVSHQLPAGARLRMVVRGADRDHFLLPSTMWSVELLGGTTGTRLMLPVVR